MYKIMVVDDDDAVIKLVGTKLAQEGYSVITASNGYECLMKIQEEKPDLLLLDIMMPEMNGLEVPERSSLTGKDAA